MRRSTDKEKHALITTLWSIGSIKTYNTIGAAFRRLGVHWGNHNSEYIEACLSRYTDYPTPQQSQEIWQELVEMTHRTDNIRKKLQKQTEAELTEQYRLLSQELKRRKQKEIDFNEKTN